MFLPWVIITRSKKKNLTITTKNGDRLFLHQPQSRYYSKTVKSVLGWAKCNWVWGCWLVIIWWPCLAAGPLGLLGSQDMRPAAKVIEKKNRNRQYLISQRKKYIGNIYWVFVSHLSLFIKCSNFCKVIILLELYSRYYLTEALDMYGIW